MGGHAWVEDRPGGGARFVVELPRPRSATVGASRESTRDIGRPVLAVGRPGCRSRSRSGSPRVASPPATTASARSPAKRCRSASTTRRPPRRPPRRPRRSRPPRPKSRRPPRSCRSRRSTSTSSHADACSRYRLALTSGFAPDQVVDLLEDGPPDGRRARHAHRARADRVDRRRRRRRHGRSRPGDLRPDRHVRPDRGDRPDRADDDRQRRPGRIRAVHARWRADPGQEGRQPAHRTRRGGDVRRLRRAAHHIGAHDVDHRCRPTTVPDPPCPIPPRRPSAAARRPSLPATAPRLSTRGVRPVRGGAASPCRPSPAARGTRPRAARRGPARRPA